MHSLPCKSRKVWASIVISMSVYLSVCLSTRISPELYVRSLPNFTACCIRSWLDLPPGKGAKSAIYYCFVSLYVITAYLDNQRLSNRRAVNSYFSLLFSPTACSFSLLCDLYTYIYFVVVVWLVFYGLLKIVFGCFGVTNSLCDGNCPDPQMHGYPGMPKALNTRLWGEIPYFRDSGVL